MGLFLREKTVSLVFVGEWVAGAAGAARAHGGRGAARGPEVVFFFWWVVWWPSPFVRNRFSSQAYRSLQVVVPPSRRGLGLVCSQPTASRAFSSTASGNPVALECEAFPSYKH